jgi:hypothetical protein
VAETKKMRKFVAVTSLSVPRYDKKGEITNRNDLVRGGQTFELDPDLHEDLIQKGLERLALRELSESEAKEPEQVEGSEVNGPGVSALQTFPVSADANLELAALTPEQREARAQVAAGQATAESGPRRPAKTAKIEDWQAYATLRGVDFDEKDTKSQIQAKVDAASAAPAE